MVANIERNVTNNSIQILSNEFEIEYDTLSIISTSCSDSTEISDNLKKKSHASVVIPNDSSIINNCERNGNIGSICVQNSRDITFGNKTYFNGPVVIKNFIVDNEKPEAAETKAELTSNQKVNCCFQHKRIFIFSIVTSLVVIIASTITGYYLYFLDNIDDYEFVSRLRYGALPPKIENEPLDLPIKRVIIGHTVTKNCTTYIECAGRVLAIQSEHMNIRDWNDIGFNFLVGGDGRAYEGRGFTVGAHTFGYNTISICISFIGDFSLYKAPEKQLIAAQRLIDEGIKMKKIHPEYILYGQRQVRNLDSPGILLYNQITSWPNWQDKIIPL